MQGRLSPPADGRIQSFPVDSWRDEFPLAREAGLACIEWIYEATDGDNPLNTDDGISEIVRHAKATGVAVRSICADYYMERRLVSDDATVQSENVAHLRWLISRAKSLAVRYIVLPFVDSSSLKTHAQLDALFSILQSLIPVVEQADLELHLETDLAPGDLAAFLQRVDYPLICANYDIGNSAALGYDPREELTLIGTRLGSVHVKDRIRGGHTVPLGTGSADLPTCFKLIKASGFSGVFILQAARDQALTEVALAKRNREFVEQYIRVL